MIYAGADHECGHPMVHDNPDEPARCAVCTPSLTWRCESRPHHPHPHNLQAAACS